MAAVSVKRSIVQSNYFSAGDWGGGGWGEVLAIMVCTGNGKAPSEMDTFFKPLVCAKVGIFLVEVYERV